MKKLSALTVVAIAALSLSSVQTNAAVTITNETGTSSMHGVNGQVEHYHKKQNPFPYKINTNTHKNILLAKYRTKKLQVILAKKRDAHN